MSYFEEYKRLSKPFSISKSKILEIGFIEHQVYEKVFISPSLFESVFGHRLVFDGDSSFVGIGWFGNLFFKGCLVFGALSVVLQLIWIILGIDSASDDLFASIFFMIFIGVIATSAYLILTIPKNRILNRLSGDIA